MVRKKECYDLRFNGLSLDFQVFEFHKDGNTEDKSDKNDQSIEDFAKSSKLIRMLRLWYPLPQKKHVYLQRFTLFKKLNGDSQLNYIKVQKPYSWKCIQNIQIDPEHCELLSLLKLQNEQQVGFSGKELTEDEFIFDPASTAGNVASKSGRKTQAILMTGAQFSLEDQFAIYRYFFSQTFPYFYLTMAQFEEFMLKIGWTKEQIPDLFHAFKSRASPYRDYMSYPEFISGMQLLLVPVLEAQMKLET